MISTLVGLLGLAGSAAGLFGGVGGLLKLLGKFAPTLATSVLAHPLWGIIAKPAEGFFDLIWWGAKAILAWLFTRIGAALDHIFSNGFAGMVFIASMVLAYEVGGWGKGSPRAAAVSQPVARSAPATPVPKAGPATTPQTSTDPFDWITSHFR